MSFRETRDLAEVQRSRLICTASMAASPDIDIGKAMPSVMRDMTENAHMMMPYFTMETNDEPADPNSDDYAECFKLLDEMEESESPEATHIST